MRILLVGGSGDVVFPTSAQGFYSPDQVQRLCTGILARFWARYFAAILPCSLWLIGRVAAFFLGYLDLDQYPLIPHAPRRDLPVPANGIFPHTN